jgi:hypothetical protein
MDDKHLRIRDKVQAAYDAIKKAEEDLELLRKVCGHPETEVCTYQWGGPGHYIDGATICSVCGELLKTPMDDMVFITSTTDAE